VIDSRGNGPDPRPRRVLVVEDDPDTARSLEILIGEPGLETRVAANGLAALVEVRAFRPHLILLDIGLPYVDGFEVFRTLRHEAALPQVHVIFLTAGAFRGALALALELGADAAFTKPYDPERLRRAVFESLGLERPLAPAALPNGRGPHVALVSSEPQGEVIGAALREAIGEQVVLLQHESAVAAIRHFRIARPDLAIVDLDLRDLDGLSLVKLLKADSELGRVPIVLLARSAHWRSAGLALESGAEASAQKPIERQALARLVRDVYRAGCASVRG
jgi:DNA-binding response OmpR family regulator